MAYLYGTRSIEYSHDSNVFLSACFWRRQDNSRSTAKFPPDTHLNWRQANSVKSLRSCYQDKYSRDHTVRPRQIMAIEQSKGNPYSYKPAWRKLGAARAEAVGGEASGLILAVMATTNFTRAAGAGRCFQDIRAGAWSGIWIRITGRATGGG
jgi:hypothetical protein